MKSKTKRTRKPKLRSYHVEIDMPEGVYWDGTFPARNSLDAIDIAFGLVYGSSEQALRVTARRA